MNKVCCHTKYGSFVYYKNDAFIGRSLELYGEYSEGEPELWRKFIKPGSAVLDIGANIGVFTRALSEIVGKSGRVVAVEAQRENYTLLLENSTGYENIITLHLACSSKNNETINSPSLTVLEHNNYGQVELGSGDSIIDTITIDSLTEAMPVDFIKVDVEGMELEVLRGAFNTIKTQRPILYVENDRLEKSSDLITYIRSFDYRVFEHLPPLFSANNFNKNSTNVFDGIVSINILCIPEERVYQYTNITKTLRPIIPSTPSCGKTGWAGIVRLGGIGDNLIAASVLPLLKKRGYKIDVITQPPQSVVFENNPYIDKLSVKIAERDLPQNDMPAWQGWFASRSNEYDVFVNLSHSCEGLLAVFPAMTYFWWPDAARRKLFGKSYIEMVHDIVNVPYEFGPLFFPTDEERDHAIQTKYSLPGGTRRAVVGWCISGTRIDKMYPQSPMAIARLIKELDVHVVMLGAPGKDFEIAKQIQEHVTAQNGTDAGLHLALSPDLNNPSWPIRRILSFAIHGCDLVIGPDTGPLWAVAFEPVPKIVLLGHASEENITKHWINAKTLAASPQVTCHPCHCLHDTIETCLDKQRRAQMAVNPNAKGAACIASISVEVLIQTAAALLETKNG